MSDQEKQNTDNIRKTYRAIIAEWVTLAGVVVGCFFMLMNQISALDSRVEQRMAIFEQRMDQLYQNFIDLLKAGK